MGSDFSYQDLLESEQLSDLYQFSKEGGKQSMTGKSMLLTGWPGEGAEPAYYQRKFWVDSERFVTLREEMYATGGQLLKVMKSKEVTEVTSDRWLPLKQIMEDKLRKDTKTTHIITKIELDYEITEDMFSLDYLQ